MRILAVALQAGGVGKTTVTYNLGALLADRGRKVLLVDLDAQCNLTEACNVEEPQRTVFESLAWIETPVPVAEAVVPVSGRDTLHIIPSSPKMATLDLALAAVDHREYRLREALEPLDGAYDYVLLDCPPGLGIVLLNALLASAEVLVPVQTRQRRVNALPVFLKMLVRAQRYHPQLRVAGIVPNQYDRRNSHDQQALGYVERFAAKHGFTLFRAIPTTTRIPEAESHRVPLCDYDRSTAAADALEDLAERIDTPEGALTASHRAAGSAQ
jgi:chromosome partitioning protein